MNGNGETCHSHVNSEMPSRHPTGLSYMAMSSLLISVSDHKNKISVLHLWDLHQLNRNSISRNELQFTKSTWIVSVRILRGQPIPKATGSIKSKNLLALEMEKVQEKTHTLLNPGAK